MRQYIEPPDVRAAKLAALWAQHLDLPVGNLWEPPITRAILREWNALGADANAWGLTETLFRMRLGLES